MEGASGYALSAAWRRIANLPRITFMARMRFAPISAQRMHGGDGRTCELMHVIQGEDRVVTRHGHVLVRAGDTVLIPGVAHRDQFDTHAGLEVFEIGFAWPEGDALIAALGRTPRKIRSARARREAAGLIEAMQTDLVWDRDADRLVAQSRLMTLLFVMARDSQDRGRDLPPKTGPRGADLRRRVLVQRARVYISSHYRDLGRMQDVARALGVSRYYLSRVFQAETGGSLMAYLTRVRMEQAKSLLSREALRVDEAARAVGYRDSRYFAKVFHQYFGFSPRVLRV